MASGRCHHFFRKVIHKDGSGTIEPKMDLPKKNTWSKLSYDLEPIDRISQDPLTFFDSHKCKRYNVQDLQKIYYFTIKR